MSLTRMAAEREAHMSKRFRKGSKVLASTAFKVTYQAFDSEEALDVAWNELFTGKYSEKELEKTLSELRLLETLSHRNITNVFASWSGAAADGERAVVYISELIQTTSLQAFLKSTSSLNFKVLRRWGFNLLSGLAYMHGLNPPVIHLELNSQNIFLNGPKGEVKIANWGLSRLKDRQRALAVIDAPEFMAPEMHDDHYDEKVDIYAFGMIMLHMVTMDYPFGECETTAMILRKVFRGQKPLALTRMKECELKKIITRCLAPAEERPRAEELRMHPFFRDWREDPGTSTSLELMTDASMQTDERRSWAESQDLTIGARTVHNVSSMDRDVIISGQKAEADEVSKSDESTSPLALGLDEEGEGIHISVRIPLEGSTKKVEFMFDMATDVPADIAVEMQHEFHLDSEQRIRVEDQIREQIARYKESASKKVPVQASAQDSFKSASTVPSASSLSSLPHVPSNRPPPQSGLDDTNAKRPKASGDKGAAPARPADIDPQVFKLSMGLMQASQQGDREGVIRRLQAGADPNFADYDRRTPLHLAIEEDNLDVVQTLLDNGAKLDLRDRWGTTAMESAVSFNRRAILELLQSYGGQSVDLTAAQSLQVVRSKHLLQHCACGSLAEIREQLMGGADVTYANVHGQTALHIAAARGDVRIVELLLLNDADPCVKDAAGRTALDEAATRDDRAMLKLFRSYEAVVEPADRLRLPEPATRNPFLADSPSMVTLENAKVGRTGDEVEGSARSRADSSSMFVDSSNWRAEQSITVPKAAKGVDLLSVSSPGPNAGHLMGFGRNGAERRHSDVDAEGQV